LDYENVEFKYDIAFILNCLDLNNCGTKIGANPEFLDRRLVRERTNKFNFLSTKKQYQEYFEEKDSEYSYQQADKVMNSIARHFRKTILKKHIGCIKELTRYSNK
jgi:hypothetical protein